MNVTTIDRKAKAGSIGVGDDGGPFDPGGPPDGPDDSQADGYQPDKNRIGMWVALASILMLFAALVSAYIVRQSNPAPGLTWNSMEPPQLLWLNTAVLLASSVTLEVARRSLGRARFVGFSRWMSVTTLLGAGFLAGQIVAWRQLAAQGIYLSSTPHSSFFYVLTSLHAVHLLGGVIALLYVTVGGFRYNFGPARRTGVDVTALYWHFMDGLWVALFLLLMFRR